MRVVVTGYGLVTAAGDDADSCWQSYCATRSGIGQNTIVPMAGVMSDRAGQVRTLLEPTDAPEDRAVRLGRLALSEALRRAGLAETTHVASNRVGLSLGTSLGGARTGEAFHRRWIADGLAAADPRLLTHYPLHATADALAAEFDLLGPRVVHTNACAAGAVAVANGVEFITSDQADIVVAGGVDPLAYLSFAGFSSLGVLSQLNCAPYTRGDGITLGEGAGFLVLEDLDRARARGAEVFAEFLGYGLSADAYHPTAPDPRGRGAVAAMEQACRMAGLALEDIDYVNSHGTGTPANDHGEMKTIKLVGGGRTPMSSTKSMTGHTLGAAGAVEAVVSVMSLQHQTIHPTHVPLDDAAQAGLAALPADVDIVAHGPRPATLGVVLSNSFAFGGNNASLLFATSERADSLEHQESPAARITVRGHAMIVGEAGCEQEVAAALRDGRPLYGRELVELPDRGSFPVGRADKRALAKGINPRLIRRLDQLGLLAVQATHQLLAGAGLTKQQVESTGLLLATSTGPLETVERFQRGVLTEGEGDAKLFPNTVMNAAAGHVAMMFGCHGPTATICSGWSSGLAGLHLASQVLARGTCERIILLAVDEAPDALLAGYSGFDGYLSREQLRAGGGTGTVFSESAVALLLENRVEDAHGLDVLGMGMVGDASGPGGLRRSGDGWRTAIERALAKAGVRADEIDVVASAATGRERMDAVERRVLESLGLRQDVVLLHPKEVTGETQAAAPLVGMLAAESLPGVAGSGRLCLSSVAGVGGSYQALVTRL